MTLRRRSLDQRVWRGVAAVAAALLAGCSSTTGGHEVGGATNARPAPSAAPSTTATSSEDFPSSSGATDTGAPSTTSASSSASASTSAAPPVPIHPAPAAPLRTVTVHGEHATYVVKIWQRRVDPSCQGHSYGKPVTDFLARHKCFGLERILATTTVQGREVGFSQISTGFPGTAKDPYRTTGQFSALVQKDGTGSINDLLREGYRLPSGPTSVPSPDAFDVLGQDNGIRIYDMWYLSGPTPNNAKPLETMSQDVFLQF